uniref:PKcGMP_CC domain-containing protein n=1 Tax=Anopheles albimanus TaxID=7167 RepID=A0A182F5P9_ANOAL
MRVCFDGLCFASRRPAVEQETQTVLCGATGLDVHQLGRLLKYTNFAAPSSVLGAATASASTSPVLTSGPVGAKRTVATDDSDGPCSTPSVSAHGSASSDRRTVVDLDAAGRQLVGSTVNRQSAARNGVASLSGHAMSDGTMATPVPVPGSAPNTDTVNNNFDPAGTIGNSAAASAAASTMATVGYKQLAALQADQQVQSTLQNLFIGDGTGSGGGGLSPQVQELLKIVQVKDIRIRELEDVLRQKNDEVAELRSQLDKFQSVFRTSGGGTVVVSPGGRKLGTTAGGGVQRQRAQGISAEPQSESSVLELMHVTFPKYDKEDRYVPEE